MQQKIKKSIEIETLPMDQRSTQANADVIQISGHDGCSKPNGLTGEITGVRLHSCLSVG